MKKPVCLFTAILLLYQFAHSQVQAGLKGGLNLADVYVENDESSRARIAFYAGGFVNIALPNNLFLQPELLYSVKGKRTVATVANNESTLSLNYVTVPLLLGYRYNKNFSIAVGPEAGFLLGANSRFNGLDNNVSAFYRKFDLGVDLDLSYLLAKTIGFNVRYNYGFKDLINGVFTDANGNVVSQARIGANRVLQAGLYFLVGGKGR